MDDKGPIITGGFPQMVAGAARCYGRVGSETAPEEYVINLRWEQDTLPGKPTGESENPAVTGSPHLRFYAGYPLILSGGQCIGSFCIADTRPRQLDPDAASHLARMADLALRTIEAYRVEGSGSALKPSHKMVGGGG
jgi:GAF domain-containing protein